MINLSVEITCGEQELLFGRVGQWGVAMGRHCRHGNIWATITFILSGVRTFTPWECSLKEEMAMLVYLPSPAGRSGEVRTQADYIHRWKMCKMLA